MRGGGLRPAPSYSSFRESQMDGLIESVMKDRMILIDAAVLLGISRDVLEGLSMDSLRTVLSYETEAKDGPETTPTTGE